jgi:trimeric autotransporter adhesin
MRAARRSIFSSFISALVCAVVLLSCGGDSTGPGGNGSVTVDPASASLALGASRTLTASVNGHVVSGSSVFWNTENAQVATVSSAGVVTGIAIGVVRIAASVSGNSGFSTITVIPPSVDSVRVTGSSEPIKIGETVHFVALPLDATGHTLTGRTITWSSANASVATVDSTGLVTGVSVGPTTISATCEGQTGSALIAVVAAVPASITVAPASVPITTGQTSQLTATVMDANGAVISGALVTWSVDHANIAIVSSTGLVTGQAQGAAIVTATSGSVHFDVPVTVTLPPANAVIVSPSSVALLVTQQQQLTATVTDAGGNTLPGQTVTWTSSDPTIATVGTTGLVFAILPGTATITGTSGTASGVSHVTVSLVPVRRVTVDPDALPFLQGDPGTQLTVTLLDSAGGTLSPAGRPVTFSSNNTSVALVNATGFVTPTGVGQAVITATAVGTGLSATSTVTVRQVPVASVTITPSLDTLIVGQQVQLAATTKDANGNTLTGRAIAWLGSDDNVAVVTSTGKVIASQTPGTMTVTATSEGITGTATIVVLQAPVATVAISPLTQTVVVGSSTPAFTAVTKDGSGNVLTGRVVTFASSDPTIATINSSTGVATGVAPGSVSITASSEGQTSPAATLTVTAVPVASVTISPLTQTVVDGANTPAFSAVTKDGGGNVLTGRVVTFASSDLTIATVNSGGGVATGQSPGSASITASSEGKTSPAATLTVTAVPVATVTISPLSQTVVNGSTTPAFTAVTKDAGGNVLTGRVVTFASSDPTIATVNSGTGVATGQSPGSASITASSEGKTSAPATLTVTPVPVNNVVLLPASQSVQVGSTVTFTATPRDASNNPLSGRMIVYSSSDPTIATIGGSTGVATGVAPGSVTIGAISEGKNATASLTVTPVPVASVTVSPSSQTIIAGNSTTTPYSSVEKDGGGNTLTGRVVTWETSDHSIATIDNAGNATSFAPGTVTITATSEGRSGTASLVVNPVPVASVDIAPALAALLVGGTQQFTATPRDASSNALTGRVVTWASSDVTLATVDNAGLVTAVATGLPTITATSEGVNSLPAVVTILP